MKNLTKKLVVNKETIKTLKGLKTGVQAGSTCGSDHTTYSGGYITGKCATDISI
jgi:hypothetical protein